MFNNKKTTIVIILILFMIGGFYTYSILHNRASSSELQPSKNILNTYIPGVQHLHTYGYGHRVENNIIYEDRSVAEHFELIGDITKGTPSCFPAVSQYSSYVYYRRNGTYERYLIASWYFNDEKQFTQARIDLATYIKEHGTATPSGCVFSTDPSGLVSSEFVASRHFDITRYASNTTSGYFMTYINPFSADQNDYFIVYYGLMEASWVSEQTRLALRELMAEGYYSESGMVEPLLDEEYFRGPGWKTNATGPGLPPPAGMPNWYIPGTGILIGENGTPVIKNGTPVVGRSVAEHFELIGDRMEGYPFCFPAVSQYCGYANYTRTGSDDRYLIAAWYFDDSKNFLQAEEDLYQYLEEYGRISTVELDIDEEMDAEIKRRESRLAWGPTFGPKRFNVTEYESETTSGYFLVYKKPFLAGRDDYFIVYYGLMGSVNLSNQAPFLKELITDGYYLNEPGTVGELKS